MRKYEKPIIDYFGKDYYEARKNYKKFSKSCECGTRVYFASVEIKNGGIKRCKGCGRMVTAPVVDFKNELMRRLKNEI